MRSKVLVIEDTPADEWLIVRALKSVEPEMLVSACRDAESGIARLEEFWTSGGCPDLILLDLNLPRGTGFTVLSWLRQDPRPLNRVPVVVLSGSNDPNDIQRAYAFGADCYIMKPGSGSELHECVGQAVRFWLTGNGAPLACAS